ncbi:uncharacterized protein LOC125034110 [Penaeus chinensis]|uniref:uncharacterized protein LOC125034110 n=1 Tax=Penaeus chinensis TaxID=139456 RepID=UPI001FB5A7BE|nr:uncharacterized protein LOC125034110 [Penaeus chinensis]
MATKKAAAKERRQQYKHAVLNYIKEKGEDDAHEREEVLSSLTSDLGLSKDDRNSLNQVITTMIAQGLIILELDGGIESIRLEDPDKSINKDKKKRKKMPQGKRKRFRPLTGPPSPSTILTGSTPSTSMAVEDSDVESD